MSIPSLIRYWNGNGPWFKSSKEIVGCCGGKTNIENYIERVTIRM